MVYKAQVLIAMDVLFDSCRFPSELKPTCAPNKSTTTFSSTVVFLQR